MGMSDAKFDLHAWLARIGYAGPRAPTLDALRGLVTAHTASIPFEGLDVFLGRVPKLDLASLQRKMIAGGRGGYCFEQNLLFRAGLQSLGFTVASLLARVVRGGPADDERPATHMLLRVDLPEGAFLADVGYGNQTPTMPLMLAPGVVQQTPHEPMRLLPVGEELTLQVRPGEAWQNLYRLSLRPALDIDYEVANWFTATHATSPFVANMIVARPGADGLRRTLFNGQVSTRRAGELIERHLLADPAAHASVLRETFRLTLSEDDVAAAVTLMMERGIYGVGHPGFG